MNGVKVMNPYGKSGLIPVREMEMTFWLEKAEAALAEVMALVERLEGKARGPSQGRGKGKAKGKKK